MSMEEENAALKLENEELRQEIEMLEDQIVQLEKKNNANQYSKISIPLGMGSWLSSEFDIKKLK
jgi:regulator of replication initiation timing